MGRAWARVLRDYPDAEATGYVDVNPEALNSAAEALDLPKPRLFTDLEQALQQVEADVVLVATPPDSHRRVTESAFEAGLDVITEKPLSGTWEDALAMVETAESTGKTLMVSQNYRFRPACRTVRRLLAENVVGQLSFVGLQFYKASDFGKDNFRTLMEYPLLIDMSIHHFDLLRFMTQREALEAFCASFRPAWTWYKHEPSLSMTLRLEGGVVCNYSACWSSPGDETPWDGRWRFQGSDGTLLWDEQGIRAVLKGGQTRTFEVAPLPYTDQAYTLYEFARAKAEGRPPETNAKDNLYSLAMEYMALDSLKTGCIATSRLQAE